MEITFKANEVINTKKSFHVLPNSNSFALTFIKPLIKIPPKNRIAIACNPIFDYKFDFKRFNVVKILYGICKSEYPDFNFTCAFIVP